MLLDISWGHKDVRSCSSVQPNVSNRDSIGSQFILHDLNKIFKFHFKGWKVSPSMDLHSRVHDLIQTDNLIKCQNRVLFACHVYRFSIDENFVAMLVTNVTAVIVVEKAGINSPWITCCYGWRRRRWRIMIDIHVVFPATDHETITFLLFLLMIDLMLKMIQRRLHWDEWFRCEWFFPHWFPFCQDRLSTNFDIIFIWFSTLYLHHFTFLFCILRLVVIILFFLLSLKSVTDVILFIRLDSRTCSKVIDM